MMPMHASRSFNFSKEPNARDVFYYILTDYPWVFGSISREFLAAGGEISELATFDHALTIEEVEKVTESLT